MPITPRMPQIRQPSSVEEILPALRTVVTRQPDQFAREGLGIKPTDRVLIVTDSTISPLLPEGLSRVIREMGGHADVVNLEGYPLMDDPLELVDGPNTTKWFPNWIFDAANQADVLICLAFFKHPHTPNLPWGRGVENAIKARPKQWNLAPDMLLSSVINYPSEVWEAIDDKTHELMAGARRIEITEVTGDTRLTFDLADEDWAGLNRAFGEEEAAESSKPYTPGHLYIPFPKSKKLEGEITIRSLTFAGPVEPARLTVEGRKVTQVHGSGRFADRLRESFEEYKDETYAHLPGPGANWISTFALCTNPKYRRSPSWEFARGSARAHSWCLGHKRSGFLHASVGAALVNPDHKLIRHFDMMFTTVMADGRPVIQDGHLVALDAPEVRAVAERFGDPDELLREDWIPDPVTAI